MVYKKEIEIPENVEIKFEKNTFFAKGPLGETKKEIKSPFLNKIIFVEIDEKNRKIVVKALKEKKKYKAMVGTIIAHVRNLIRGVTKGYKYIMKIVYTHFPINVKIEGKKVIISNFLGEKTPRVAEIVGNTKVTIKGDTIEITGINIEEVGQTANNIEQATRITGKDRRVFQDGIYIYEKKLPLKVEE